MTKITLPIADDDFDESALFQNTNANPLASYFRIPGSHVPLPTRGAFLPPNAYNETLAGDIPVYPMKAADELLLRSPDALLSGYALEKLMLSCVPDIKTPRLISVPDLDVLLLAIRAATYGDVMEVEMVCPNCNTVNTFDCNLPAMMGTMTFIDPVNSVKLSNDVEALVRPYNMICATKAARGNYDIIRSLQIIEDNTATDEAKTAVRNESYEKMSKLNLEVLTDCIISIQTPEGIVTNREFISEFVNNTSQAWIKKIDEKLGELNTKGLDKRLDAKCAKCEHEWRPEIEFDPTSFFGQGS